MLCKNAIVVLNKVCEEGFIVNRPLLTDNRLGNKYKDRMLIVINKDNRMSGLWIVDGNQWRSVYTYSLTTNHSLCWYWLSAILYKGMYPVELKLQQ